MSNICNAKKYVVPNTDANYDVTSRSTINRKRGAKQSAWEDTTVELVKSKRRRMIMAKKEFHYTYQGKNRMADAIH